MKHSTFATLGIRISRELGRESAAPWNEPLGLLSCHLPTLYLHAGKYTCTWFSSWILELLSQESNPSFLILHGFTTVFHSSHNFSLEIRAKVLTAVQHEPQPMGHTTCSVLHRGGSRSPHTTFLHWAGCERSSCTFLVLVLCFSRAPRGTCTELLETSSAEGREKK